MDGIIYASAPDNVYAIDARDGTILWHYYWKTRGGTSLATRGLGMWHDRIFFELHDDWMVSLDAKTGKEMWKKEISSFDAQYFSSNAPMIFGNHVIAGTGNDMDSPGFIKSYDPETGEQQSRPSRPQCHMNAGDPGVEAPGRVLTPPAMAGRKLGLPGAYDPDTHLYIFRNRQPDSGLHAGRGEGDNLYTCSLVAVNVDTGKMAWYYQTSPHDTHDWDSTQTPVLADMPFGGRMAGSW